MAANIVFEVENNQNVNGSGLGFYGQSFGTSVQLGAYQDTTFITNASGNAQGPAARNVKYPKISSTDYPMSGLLNDIAQTGLMCKLNSSEATLIIHFDNDTAVNVQNAQLRIYDRANINNPASGVNTKVCELVNFAGSSTYDAWNLNNGIEFNGNPVGSGDAFWWGAPWPDDWLYVTNGSSKPYYYNSVGVSFYNYTQIQINASATSGNPDSRLGIVTGDRETVGGSGLIVPLLNNPGSGGRNLIGYTGLLPKFIHYVKPTSQNTYLGMSPTYSSGTQETGYTITNRQRAYGGTGTDTRHTWRLALSATPLNIGSKTDYGLYISLEYL